MLLCYKHTSDLKLKLNFVTCLDHHGNELIWSRICVDSCLFLFTVAEGKHQQIHTEREAESLA